MNAPAPTGTRILLTAFAPFDGETVNPSWEALAVLQGRRVGPHTIEVCRLPVSFQGARAALDAALVAHDPILVLCLGQAGGRTAISVERVALNLMDARIPDAGGDQPIDAAIDPSGPPARFATVPVKAMVAAMRDEGIPAELSLSAGTYVCNTVMYHLLDRLSALGPGYRGGFLHVPYLPEQAARHPGSASMDAQTVRRGVMRCVETALALHEDLHTADGALA